MVGNSNSTTEFNGVIHEHLHCVGILGYETVPDEGVIESGILLIPLQLIEVFFLSVALNPIQRYGLGRVVDENELDSAAGVGGHKVTERRVFFVLLGIVIFLGKRISNE
jgi:hypothetical protein